MLREDMLAAFIEEYEAETRRLQIASTDALPGREVELAQVRADLATIKTAILKGVDASMFVDELSQLGSRRTRLMAEIDAVGVPLAIPTLLHPALGNVYPEKVAELTDAFQDDVLRAQAFERIRALIEAVVLTPDAGDLKIHLTGELASMLELCACAEMRNAPEAVASGALQIKMVAGTGFEPVTFRL